MLTRRVRSLHDQTLQTGVQEYDLIKDEVFDGVFKNSQVLDGLIDIGAIEDVPQDTPLLKDIPVVLPEVPIENLCPYMSHEQPEMILLDEEGNQLPLSSVQE